MRDLTQHLTTRADDSRAPPVFSSPEGELPISWNGDQCQDLVRFFALRRIKPHTPPLVRAPVNSFEFHTCVHTPQAEESLRWLRHRGSTPGTCSSSFTAWTTRVSNPICSPRFRASASATVQAAAFATGVLPYIYAFYRYTWSSTALSCTQSLPVSRAIVKLSLPFSLQTIQAACAPFTPNHSG